MKENTEHLATERSSSFPEKGHAAAPVKSDAYPEVTPEKTPLHRVIDVPLAVTIRFGQRHLTVRELLELSTGSLVELDRQVEEPVDLMLGERVVARGEVVIVDGNYGMRVTEVIEMPPSAWNGRAALANGAKTPRTEAPPTVEAPIPAPRISAHG